MSHEGQAVVRRRLDLAELVAAARLAGDVPLPVHVDGAGGVPASDRLSERLTATPASAAGERLGAALRRAADPGPDGAGASLVARGLLDGEELDPLLTAGLVALAGAPLAAVLDVSATRRAGELRSRSWFGVGPGLVAQLWTGDGLGFQLACFDPRLWTARLAQAIRVEPWSRDGVPRPLPALVSLPSELMAGCGKAHREHRVDLLASMAAAHAGRVRAGEPGRVAPSGPVELLALLHTLGDGCRGRLRLLTTRRDRGSRPAVASWLLFDDGWHELRPGGAATTVLRRREPRDLGLVTQPAVGAVQQVARDG